MSSVRLHPYRPGIIGEVVRQHAQYYAAHWAFDVRFETQVARELAGFIADFDPTRDGFWWAAGPDGGFAGSVAVDGGEGSRARLRWFIVPEAYQGRGVGKLLFDRAMAFARDTGFDGVYLWTFAGLEPARRVYEKAGFALAEEKPSSQWGPAITAQRYELSTD